jgi:hypothetical protein
MKYIFTISAFLLFIFSDAQNVNYAWAKQIGGTAVDYGFSIAVDASGNVYTTGFFSGTVDFNPDPAVVNNLASAGGGDIFITKMDASGNFVWAKQMGGSFNDFSNSIALDASGNIYTTGTFYGTADFNPDPIASNNFTSAGDADIFISKLNASGNFVWAKQIGNSNFNYASNIAVNNNGVYFTGELFGTVDFNPDPTIAFSLTSAGSDDIFISKLDLAGNFVWAKQMGGVLEDNGISLALDAAGNVFATGDFKGTVDFNPDPAVTNNLTSSGDYDIYICKLDASGNFVWAKQIGGTQVDYGFDIAVDPAGNIYTGGEFNSSVDFNPDPAVINSLTSAGSNDIFILKLDASGNFVWAKRIGASANDYINSIDVDPSGVYMIIEAGGTLDLNPDPAVTNNFTSAGSDDIFISKLDAVGNFVWANQMGGTLEDNGIGIAVDMSGNVYATGDFQGIADFNPDPAVTNQLTSAGNYDIFIMKLSAVGSLPVILSGFSHSNNNCISTLKWTTASEQQSKLFEVQHSIDGINFKTIAAVPASKNSSIEKQYTYSPSITKKKNNFYRLNIVNVDGTSKLSPIVNAINNCSRNEITCYPNPAKDFTYVEGFNGENQIRLIDQLGRTVRNLKTKNQIEKIDLSHLSNGAYILQVIQNKEIIETFKVLKNK